MCKITKDVGGVGTPVMRPELSRRRQANGDKITPDR